MVADARREYELRTVLRFKAGSRQEALQLIARHFQAMADRDEGYDLDIASGGSLKLKSLGVKPDKRTMIVADRGMLSLGLCVLKPDDSGEYAAVAHTPVNVMFDPVALMDCLLHPQTVIDTELHNLVQVTREELYQPVELAAAVHELVQSLMGARSGEALRRELARFDKPDNPEGG